MNEFNNEAYHALVSDLINDAFYLEGTSHRGVIAKIRQYAEVIVRKILNLSPDGILVSWQKAAGRNVSVDPVCRIQGWRVI